jgi:hypothetical protein
MPRGVRLATRRCYTQVCIDTSSQRHENRLHAPRVGSSNMFRIGDMALVLCFMLFGTLYGRSEPAAEKTNQCDAAVKSKPSTTPLLGRSEMQEPKPIPVIRLLRLQQIPVVMCGEDLHEIFVDAQAPSVRVMTEEQQTAPATPRSSEINVQPRDGQ